MRCCRISLYISEKYIGVGTGSRNYRHSAMDAFFFSFFFGGPNNICLPVLDSCNHGYISKDGDGYISK
jgi:hypothetical protein